MSSLAALFAGYIVAVLLGKNAQRIGPGIIFVIGVTVLIEVLIVIVSMFLMDAPPTGRGGS